jgi:hypothetical protein
MELRGKKLDVYCMVHYLSEEDFGIIESSPLNIKKEFEYWNDPITKSYLAKILGELTEDGWIKKQSKNRKVCYYFCDWEFLAKEGSNWICQYYGIPKKYFSEGTRSWLSHYLEHVTWKYIGLKYGARTPLYRTDYSMSLSELWKELLIPDIIEYADESKTAYVPKIAKLIAKKELERSVLIRDITKPDESNEGVYSTAFYKKYNERQSAFVRARKQTKEIID